MGHPSYQVVFVQPFPHPHRSSFSAVFEETYANERADDFCITVHRCVSALARCVIWMWHMHRAGGNNIITCTVICFLDVRHHILNYDTGNKISSLQLLQHNQCRHPLWDCNSCIRELVTLMNHESILQCLKILKKSKMIPNHMVGTLMI